MCYFIMFNDIIVMLYFVLTISLYVLVKHYISILITYVIFSFNIIKSYLYINTNFYYIFFGFHVLFIMFVCTCQWADP